MRQGQGALDIDAAKGFKRIGLGIVHHMNAGRAMNNRLNPGQNARKISARQVVELNHLIGARTGKTGVSDGNRDLNICTSG